MRLNYFCLCKRPCPRQTVFSIGIISCEDTPGFVDDWGFDCESNSNNDCLDAELCLPASEVTQGPASGFSFLDTGPSGSESDGLEEMTGGVSCVFASVLTATAELQLPNDSDEGGMKASKSFDQLGQL